MLKPPAIPNDVLLAALVEYGIDGATLEFLPVGDTHTASYRVETAMGARLFFKLRPGPAYLPALQAPRLLTGRGITEVIAPLGTTSGELWVQAKEYAGTLFPYVEGETGWDTITPEHWREAGRIFRRIHGVHAAAAPEGIRHEAFEPSTYASEMERLDERLREFTGDGAAGWLRIWWRVHGERIERMLATMLELSERLKTSADDLVVCHADLHASNLLRDGDGNVFVIDWDDVMLAPKERDFIFTGEPGSSPFFEGYGETDVDWAAVTYYRYERVVSDLIVYASDVLRGDLSVETKTHSAESFAISLEGANYAAARRAADRLQV